MDDPGPRTPGVALRRLAGVLRAAALGLGTVATVGGNGLTGMRELIDALAGSLDISSPSCGGTRIRARLPLPSSTAATAPEPAQS